MALTPQDPSILDRAYIVRLAPEAEYPDKLARRDDLHIAAFHKRASALDYTVRYEFKNPCVFLGISIQVTGTRTDEEIFSELQALAGADSVSRVGKVGLPIIPGTPQPPLPFLSYADPPPLNVSTGGRLDSTLEMGGVDKLHRLGIKGNGMKIGIIDSGVDYRHPALGGGFGPGHKIAGGYAFTTDNGTLANTTDPLTTCVGGGHGTHVTGIIGMEPTPGGFDITGVAPEATLYMYKVLACFTSAEWDSIIAAMSKAHEDGVDIVSMSIGGPLQGFSGEPDPTAAAIQSLADAGIPVIISIGNEAVASPRARNLYSVTIPGSQPSAIGVGAISNTVFPLVYSAVDSMGTTIQYASVYPVNLPSGADIYIMSDGCSSDEWNNVLSIVDANNTIIAFEATYPMCPADALGAWSGASTQPHYIMAFTAHSTNILNPNQEDPFLSAYNTLPEGYHGSVQLINVNSTEGDKLISNFEAAGGYRKYKWKLSSGVTSAPEPAGGLMDYYSSFGPTWHDYQLKPQISAPGGHILSTWPLGPQLGYSILSGTSMAAPYIAGAFALVKSQFPKATNQEILERLQTTATPLPWVFNASMLAATPQQGAGMVNVYNAIFSESQISPGQITVRDVSRTEYGTANITIQNTSAKPKTYSFSHEGAGYMDYTLQYQELNQRPQYGSANFALSGITIPPGQSDTIHLSINPPNDVDPTSLPVFSGFLCVSDSDGESFHIPYVGAPYSIYNAAYLVVKNDSQAGIISPRVWSYDANGTIVTDYGLEEFVPDRGYGSDLSTSQWTREFRVDVLPADTNITADHYGFDRTITYPDIPSKFTPNMTVFGYPSFGMLANNTGYIWPGANGQFGADTKVMSSNGVRYLVGDGDYRWFVSVLRWGGTSGKRDDYDTWLSPILRVVSNSISTSHV
ncbi:uncharacterized protein BP5553_07411 [Venustampulla echinocandica]|uniref:Subtilisin-like protein n=1 Tax=Venustampulla echinocandica TaxID=2656787 RepID=A0A370TJF9_9HELO|nr:uncharacterized protein BP5553_07411 [Venustampulla echinocandica]RDL35480.1 hypothetical protein BP5553_07411 [Venustampulla echinocandica]